MPIPNAGQQPITTFPAGDPAAFYSTGAGGSPGGEDQSAAGASLAQVATGSNPWESAQGPRQTAAVDAGDVNQPRQVPARMPFTGVDLSGNGEPTTAGQDREGPHGTGHVDAPGR